MMTGNILSSLLQTECKATGNSLIIKGINRRIRGPVIHLKHDPDGKGPVLEWI
jgi:hypothetical protein